MAAAECFPTVSLLKRRNVSELHHIRRWHEREAWISLRSVSLFTDPVPLNCAPQALSEFNNWLIIEQFFSQLNTRQRMANITGARFFVRRLPFISRQFAENLEGLIQRSGGVGGSVHHLARDLFCRRCGGEQIGLNNVFDIRKIAALLPVPVDGYWLAREHAAAKLRQHT